MMTRREFNAQLAKIGIGLLSANMIPSSTFGTSATGFNRQYIDIHHHLDRSFFSSKDKFTLMPILNWMDRNNVSQTIIQGLIQIPQKYYPERYESEIVVNGIFEKLEATNGRIKTFCVVHPDAFNTTKELVKILKRCKKAGALGFGELKPKDAEGKSMKMALDDDRMQRIYQACGEVDFPVLIHIDNSFVVDVPGLPALESMLKKFPEVNFLGHATGWWNSISGDVKDFGGYGKGKVTKGGAVGRLLSEYSNMYADLSAGSGLNAITRDPEFGRQFLKDYAHKLLFGTDTFAGDDNLSKAHFDFFNTIDLSSDLKNMICRDNAIKLLKL